MPDRIQRGPDEPTDDRIKELADAFAEALLAGDEIGAEIAICEAIDSELTSAEIDEQLIAPALWLVGELWERGKISVAEEHLRLVLPSAGFVVGGGGLTDEAHRRPVVHVCNRVSEVVEVVDATVKRSSLN